MPLSSLQTSGMIGGQVAMFGNQSQMSQQIGSLYGTGPGPTGGAMQAPPSYGGDPFNQTQDTGSKIAGAAGMMAPMAAAGVPLAAGMMGGAAGWADPFTGAARGFARGVGAGGGGFGATMGQIGAGFGRGALPGLARLGAGVGMAGLAAAPAAAAGMAAVEAGQQFYQGVQTTQDMERVSGQMAGPQYGAGSRPGGKLDRGQIRQMVSVIEELADDNVMASVQTVTKLADKFSQMGMLTGSVDASSFKQKFSNMVKQTDIIAKMMGTSMEEAAPMLQKFQQMGMWTAGDIMGGSAAMKMAGPQGAQQLGATMGAGAQMVHGMGGRLGAGALAGQKAFMNVQGATNIGALSNQDITEFTGGVGGREGQRMVAQGMMGMTARMAQSPMGKLAVAGMGQFEDGEFTGEMDPEMMRKLKAGQLDIGALEKRGRKLTGTREGAASYMMQQKKMQGELVGKGGLEGSAAMMQMVLDKSGHSDSSDDIQATVLKHITGATERDVEMAMKMMEKLPQIKEDNRKRMKDMLSQRERELDIRMNRSLSGAKDAIKQRWESAWRPLRESGADMAQDLGESIDEAWQGLIGGDRSGGIDISPQQRNQILRTRGLVQPADMDKAGSRLETGTGMIESFARGGMAEGAQSRKEALQRMGQNLQFKGGDGQYDLGEGTFSRVGETNEAYQRTQRLAGSNFTLASVGYSGGPDSGKHVETLKKAMITAASSEEGRNLMMLRSQGKVSHGEFRKQMMGLVRLQGGGAVRKAVESLREGKAGGSGQVNLDMMELMAVAAGEEDVSGFRESSKVFARKELSNIPTSRKELKKNMDETVSSLAESFMRVQERDKPTGIAARALVAMGRAEKEPLEKKEIMRALTKQKWSSDLREWVAKGKPDDIKGNKFLEAARRGDPDALKMFDFIKSHQGLEDSQFMNDLNTKVGKMQDLRAQDVTMGVIEERASVAQEEEVFTRRTTASLSSDQSRKYKEVLKLYKSTNVDDQELAAAKAAELGVEVQGNKEAMGALASGGGVGRMIAGLGMSESLLQARKGKPLSKRDFKKALGKLGGALQMDIGATMTDDERAQVAEMEEGGYDAKELEKVRGIVGKMAKDVGPQKTMRELIERQEIVADKFGEVAGRLTRLVPALDAKLETQDPGEKNSSQPEDRDG